LAEVEDGEKRLNIVEAAMGEERSRKRAGKRAKKKKGKLLAATRS